MGLKSNAKDTPKSPPEQSWFLNYYSCKGCRFEWHVEKDNCKKETCIRCGTVVHPHESTISTRPYNPEDQVAILIPLDAFKALTAAATTMLDQVKYLAPERFDDDEHEKNFNDNVAGAEKAIAAAEKLIKANEPYVRKPTC